MSIPILTRPQQPRPDRRVRAWGASAALLGTLLALGLAGCSGPAADPLLSLSVNGQSVSLTTFQRIVEIQKFGATSQGQSTAWQTPSGRANLSSAQTTAYTFLSDLVLIHADAQQQHVAAADKDVLKQATSLSSNLTSQLAQNPTDPSLQALAAAAKQAAKTEKTERPRLETLLAGRSTLSDAIILYAYEGADVQALFAKGTVPSAHVRVIELGSKQAANALQRQLETHKADFTAYAQAHSLDTATGQKGGELGTFRVGELSQQNPALDNAIFGPSANYSKATAYIVMPISNGKVLVLEVTKRAHVALSSISDAQLQNSIFGGWLQVIARPGANIQEYVAVDPTPAPTSATP
jgi:hypothetical protein